ncbi:aspartyl protease family protein [Novosphingobium sp.]|uniref:aspartyl protease family protein n=1 Tax=Novosphingobium sp. TaxID=1874826 RepID=UPI0025DD0CE4|nr:aspartyl protease family protein [Novosphingobium sp.]
MTACLRAFVALIAFAAQPALAAEASKCKATLVAKFPVVMEGPRASVPVSFNGKPSRVWLDSGAFFNVMPKAKAVELGLPLEPLPLGFTVNAIGGSFTPQLARVRDFGVLGVTLHNTQFVVGGSDAGNGFLGANFLGVWDTEFDLAKGAVNLFKEAGCNGTVMAYWGNGMSIGEARLLSSDRKTDFHIYVEVIINGKSLRAMLDSGAPNSIVGRHAAEKAGIDLKAPQVVASSRMGGGGSQRRQSWIARTQTISIGGEVIRNSPIRVIDDGDDSREHDMLLGMDFLLSHHVFVSQPQRKMFLTYNGGPIFSATTDGEIGHMTTIAQDMGAGEKTVDPKTADEFAGRASARLIKGDTAGSIADFGEAIRLAPARADLLASRASAYARAGSPALASADIDAALAITPADHRLLTRRAQLRLGKGDKAGALADTTAAAAAMPRGSLDVIPVVRLFERMGLADRGLALLDPVVELHRSDAQYASLLNARSWNRGLANADLDHALKDATALIRRAGPNPAYLDTRALIELRLKDYAAAIADETAALDKLPKLAEALYVRGLARIGSGDAAGAAADLAAARSAQPNIDRRYAAYGLAAPGAELSSVNGEDDDRD